MHSVVNGLLVRFVQAAKEPTFAKFQSIEKDLWTLGNYLEPSLCQTTDKTHSGTRVDAEILDIRLFYTIIAAHTEFVLEKYRNARAFINYYHNTVTAGENKTKQSQDALKLIRSYRPKFDQFQSLWTKQLHKEEQYLDRLGVPKQTTVDQSEKPLQ